MTQPAFRTTGMTGLGLKERATGNGDRLSIRADFLRCEIDSRRKQFAILQKLPIEQAGSYGFAPDMPACPVIAGRVSYANRTDFACLLSVVVRAEWLFCQPCREIITR